ncbi:MAG: iron-sulfur cluster repair di-iron protein [candidate division Zixibacteria bacterium]|jgi:regulator of cell morphogenesis and NO signaling|nr:iron-sulfur cluster repair di-iron protein [candidate division Zixibacteria bacterium]
MTISTESTVASLATEHPLATRVFSRYGIDFCCGGGRPLKDVCGEKGLDVGRVVEEIRQELSSADEQVHRWDTRPLDKLIQHILDTYHRPLDEELPRLQQMAARVLEVHHDKDPGRLTELVDVYAGLKTELEDHMAKEEQILFPMILRGQGALTNGPIAVMEHEHESVGIALRRLRELTDDFEVPLEACNTWRALWKGLEALEQSLHVHIHLENNILFPRALEN